jgi:hypothetical protein
MDIKLFTSTRTVASCAHVLNLASGVFFGFGLFDLPAFTYSL